MIHFKFTFYYHIGANLILDTDLEFCGLPPVYYWSNIPHLTWSILLSKLLKMLTFKHKFQRFVAISCYGDPHHQIFWVKIGHLVDFWPVKTCETFYRDFESFAFFFNLSASDLVFFKTVLRSLQAKLGLRSQNIKDSQCRKMSGCTRKKFKQKIQRFR